LVASGELSIHGIMDNADDALLWVSDDAPHIFPELRPSSNVGFMEKPGRPARAGRGD
jgi:hypothetical protein